MLKIAESSKDDSGAGELSWYDLRDTDKAKLGLDDSFVVKKDLKAGILNIYKKVGDKLTTWLHIDFEMPNEKGNKSQKVKTQNAEEVYELKTKQDKENEIYGNYTVSSKEDGNCIIEVYSDGSRSEYIKNPDGFEYKEYYPNNKLKFKREEVWSCGGNGESYCHYREYAIYDENGKLLYNEEGGIEEFDLGQDEGIKYDNKKRPTSYEYGAIRYKYDDKNKIVTATNSRETIVYKMNDEGLADKSKIVSHKFVGDSGREIDLLNGGLEKLCKELHLRRTK